MTRSNLPDIDLNSLTIAQGAKVFGSAANDYSGSSVSRAGDVNGDGIDDIIIGAYQAESSTNSDSGISYVMYGTRTGLSDIDLASLSSTQGFKVIGASTSDNSGISVSAAGDVNNDGYDDVIIGAYKADPSSRTSAGISYIVFGSASPSDVYLSSLQISKGIKIYGATSNDQSGYVVSSAGDINNDGYDEVIISSHFADPNGRSNAGTVYVIFGKSSGFSNIDLASLSSTQGFKILGAASDDYCAESLGSAGDINGDGYDDIIIGAKNANPNGRNQAGTSYLIFGKASGFSDIDLSSLESSQGFKILGAETTDYSGTSVSGLGDINGDGYHDFIVGAGYAPSDDRGTSYVIFGKASGFNDIDLLAFTSDYGFKILGAAVDDYSGKSVSAAGDVNGDGYNDIIIGAFGADPNGRTTAGASYVIYGKNSGYSDVNLASLTSSQGFKILGATSGDYSGVSVSGNFDINGDGYSDVLVGAQSSDPEGRSSAGTSYIIVDSGGTFAPTAAPTISMIPTKIPTVAPSSFPTVNSTQVPTHTPSVIQTECPTLLPTDFPTRKPTSMPTDIPTRKPTSMPTDIPTRKPTISPTSSTKTPTSEPTISPTREPTEVPTAFPTKIPTFAPTEEYIAVDISAGGSYTGTSEKENFVIDSTQDTTITSGEGDDMFTIMVHSSVTTTITDFDKEVEVIDITAFTNIHNMDDLTITYGSAVVNLDDNQKVILQNLIPSDLTADNFIFATITNGDSNSVEESNTAIIAASVGAGALVMIGAVIGYYAYRHNLWCFTNKLAGEVTADSPMHELANIS